MCYLDSIWFAFTIERYICEFPLDCVLWWLIPPAAEIDRFASHHCLADSDHAWWFGSISSSDTPVRTYHPRNVYFVSAWSQRGSDIATCQTCHLSHKICSWILSDNNPCYCTSCRNRILTLFIKDTHFKKSSLYNLLNSEQRKNILMRSDIIAFLDTLSCILPRWEAVFLVEGGCLFWLESGAIIFNSVCFPAILEALIGNFTPHVSHG